MDGVDELVDIRLGAEAGPPTVLEDLSLSDARILMLALLTFVLLTLPELLLDDEAFDGEAFAGEGDGVPPPLRRDVVK